MLVVCPHPRTPRIFPFGLSDSFLIQVRFTHSETPRAYVTTQRAFSLWLPPACSSLMALPALELTPCEWAREHVPCGVWLLWLSVMLLRLISAGARVCVSSFSTAEEHSAVWLCASGCWQACGRVSLGLG